MNEWRAFDRAWFARNQRALLAGLRFDALRHALCIDDDGDIVRLLPHAYIVRERDHLRLVARAHAKYAKRMYHAFAPVWWAMHGWDWALADRLAPRLSFGFATLTEYPDPGTGGTCADAQMESFNSSGESFATHQGAASCDFTYMTGTQMPTSVVTHATTDLWTTMNRVIIGFDTSPLPDSFTVTSATLGVYAANKSDTLGSSPTLNVFGATPSSNTNYALSDYSQVDATARCDSAIAYASFTLAAYNTFAFNSTGMADIDGGIVNFALRLGCDSSASAPTWVASKTSSFIVQSSDTVGTSQDPYLEVNYTVPEFTGYLRRNRLRPRIFAPGLAR